LFSETSAAAVYWKSITPVLRPALSTRNAGRPDERPSISCAIRRSAMDPSSATAIASMSIARAIGWP
jgi:hypothetical protein